MRKIKFLAMAVFLAMVTSASAQFTNTTGGKSSSSSIGKNTDGWSTIWVEWNPSTMKYDSKNADDESFTGFSLGYSQAFSLTPNTPLFAEVGLGVQYSFKTKELGEDFDFDSEDYEALDPQETINMFSAKIPINLIYAFQIPNSSVSLLPFVGINLRYNISGKMLYKANVSSELADFLEDEYGKKWEKEDDLYWTAGLPVTDSEKDLFDKKDMGSEKATWNRFQFGWNIGVKARFGENFLVGLSYGSDFSEIAEKTKISTTSISLGYTF